MDVLLLVYIEGLEKKEIFEKHLKKEGFEPLKEEAFAYMGKTTTSLIHTETFILHVLKEALYKGDFLTCKTIFQVGENPMKAYFIDKDSKEFIQLQDPN